MTAGQSTRIDPLLLSAVVQPWLTALQAGLTGPGGRRPVLGLSAPVGCGKTTLAAQLQQLAAEQGLQLAVASIDDAYCSWEQRQERLAGNPFGVNRVPPGSHDPGLLLGAIERWQAGGALQLPRFDKTRRDGQGDRAGFIEQPADALLLEGWLVGAAPLTAETIDPWIAAGSPVADGLEPLSSCELAWLPRWNQALEEYQPLWNCCHSIWLLQPNDWRLVLRWRLQAEARQRRHLGKAMETGAIRRLVRAALASLPPALYQPGLLARATAVATLGRRRQCLEVRPQSSLSSSLIG